MSDPSHQQVSSPSLGGPAARSIIEGLSAGLPGVVYRCRNDRDWTMLGLTENVVDLTGYTPADLIGSAELSFADLIHPDDRERVWSTVQDAVGEGRAFRITYRITTREGDERWVLEQGHAVRVEGDVELLGYMQDVTGPFAARLVEQQGELDRVRREARHLEILQRVTAIVNDQHGLDEALSLALPVVCQELGFLAAHVCFADDGRPCSTGLWWTAPDEPGVEALRAVVQAEGRNPDSGLPGRVRASGVAQWVHDIGADTDRAEGVSAEGVSPEGVSAGGVSAEGGSLGGVSLGGGSSDGVVVSGVGVPVRSGTRTLAILEFYVDHELQPDPAIGQLLEQVGTQLGRTWERDQARQARREGELRFRQIAEHIDDVFWIGRPGDPAHEYVSPAFREIWGCDPDDLGDDPLLWLGSIHAGDRERVEDIIRRRAGRGYECQYRIVRPDGNVRWIWDRAYPVADAEGRIDRIVGVAEDVTERRKLEAQLRAAHRMEAVGRLAGGIAHDFNNLLTVIRAQADFLMMDLPDDNAMIEEVDVIRGAADRAAELTRQLLAFSREQVLRPRVVDLTEVVRNMHQLLIRVLGEDIRIETEFEPGLPSVRVDPAQLEQVLMNLAVNARDAMPEGGELKLSARAEVLTAEVVAGRAELAVGSQWVRLDVSDTGHGMDESVRARIFEPFYTTKRAAGGTGLGLAMAYGIVKQSGGMIHAASQVGRGTTFTLRLPPVADAPEAVHPVTARDPATGRASGRILVIEDDPAVRRIAHRILTRAGMDVIVAPDGETGLELLDEHGASIRFVLTDLVLPGMNGRRLLEEVRDRFPHVRRLAMSGYAEGSPDSRIDLPADVVFIQKPFDPEHLLAVLADLADATAGR